MQQKKPHEHPPPQAVLLTAPGMSGSRICGEPRKVSFDTISTQGMALHLGVVSDSTAVSELAAYAANF